MEGFEPVRGGDVDAPLHAAGPPADVGDVSDAEAEATDGVDDKDIFRWGGGVWGLKIVTQVPTLV